MFGAMKRNAGCGWRLVGFCGTWISLLGSIAHAGGACCVVQVAGSDQPRVAVSAVHAQSHEDVAGSTRSFAQQGAVHLERSLSFRRSLHAGARMNFGRTDLEHGGQQERVTSDAHPVGFVGWNEAWTEKIATLLEAGYGHGFLVSLGLAFPLR